MEDFYAIIVELKLAQMLAFIAPIPFNQPTMPNVGQRNKYPW